jgi:hypothetical protein
MEQGESPRPHRRFGLGDGLILLAALGLSLAGLRGSYWFGRLPTRLDLWWRTTLAMLGAAPWNLPSFTKGQAALLITVQVLDEILVQLLSWVLFGLTLAQPVLRLRRPRPPLGELVRQSGLVVCLGVILGTLISVDIMWLAGADAFFLVLYYFPALPLLLLWPILGIFPWRIEASWIDRLGRGVGWGWVIASGSVMALYYLP